MISEIDVFRVPEILSQISLAERRRMQEVGRKNYSDFLGAAEGVVAGIVNEIDGTSRGSASPRDTVKDWRCCCDSAWSSGKAGDLG